MNNDGQKIIWKKATKKQHAHPASDPLYAKDDLQQAADAALGEMSALDEQISASATTDLFDQDDSIDALRADIQRTLDALPAKKDATALDTDLATKSVTPLGEESQLQKMADAFLSKDDLSDEIPSSGDSDVKSSDNPAAIAAATSAIAANSLNTSTEVNNTELNVDQASLDIKKEIDAALTGESAALQEEEVFSATAVDKEGGVHDDIAALKESIHSELGTHEQVDSANSKSSSRGIEQTYYGDVSGAMGSNKPATMSELLKKARFEEKERKILSPKSKRNLLFIGGSLLLVALAILLLAFVFKPEKEVKFITEKRVDSLVYSNLDTGINVTDIKSEKTKQAIRKVVETEIEEGSINQVYYVAEDENKNLRRLNIKQVFEATDHTPPQLLYENIEGDFMHGVFKTDENRPFMILKTFSYDQVFEGMKEWEPSMIDDLATYFDLSSEATDRSLIQDGFHDDVISNKNVRVVRFIPRAADRTFLQDLGDKLSHYFNKAYAQAGYTIYGTVSDSETDSILPNADVFVKDLGISTKSNASGNYNIALPSAGLHLIEYKHDGYQSRSFDVNGESKLDVELTPIPTVTDPGTGDFGTGFGTPNTDSYICYQSEKKCFDQNGDDVSSSMVGQPGVNCYDDIKNGPNDQSFDSSYLGKAGYTCFKASGTQDVVGADGYLSGDGFINILRTDDVCFHAVTGQKLNTTDQDRADYVSPSHPLAVCFRSFECRRVACFDRFDNEVPMTEQGKPGITCGETAQHVAPDSTVQKVCREYTDLTRLDNISESKLCFDENGNFVQSFSTPGVGINCITPTNRNQRLCLTPGGQVVVPQPGVPLPGTPGTPYAICFDPLEGASLGSTQQIANQQVGDQFVTLNTQIQQIAAALGRDLELIAALAKITGLSQDKVDSIKDASQFFYQIAYMDVLQNETIEKGLIIVATLENVLDFIDPNGALSQPGPDGELNLFGKLSLAIDVIKDVFGFTHNITWATLGNKIPKGEEIFAGQSVAGLDAIQQALVLTGLMDPVSVTGTLDLVTQNALSEFQEFNGLETTGIVDLETLDVLTGMVDGAGNLYGGGNVGTVDDYFSESEAIGLGSYSDDVQALQIILYAEGYDIDAINGVFDPQTCEALMQYQEFNDLVLAAPDGGCTLSVETIESLNELIRNKEYLGSGFALNGKGFLEGVGSLSGTTGPGVISFATDAEAASLEEGDIVLMYTFLDEQTILITRHESVINEIIKRRALDDIFNQDK